jgi:cytochrome c-type biogenesis protein CcmE
MAQLTWEKTPEKTKNDGKFKRGSTERYKFLIGGALILGAVIYLVLSGTMTGARFFISVDEVVSNPEYVGQNVRLTGAVIGETIQYDPSTGMLNFTIANVPDGYTDLATALHEAATDSSRTRLAIHMEKQVMPDLLQHEAQAILTGKIGSDGIFYATELNLKCPSRFEENEKPALTGGNS